jgi:hypothetical protein
MASTIKISTPMADALIGTALTEDGETIRIASKVKVGTTVALMDRGLVTYNRELTRENGYEVHTLTDLGHNVRERLLINPDGREFLTSLVKEAAQKVAPKEVSQTWDGYTLVLQLESVAMNARSLAGSLTRAASEARAAFEATH